MIGVLWWSWGGYAWLTSVLNPDEGVVRIAMFAAMAALLVAALCVPEAFGDAAFLFVAAYGVVPIAHIVLFAIPSRGDAALRASVTALSVSSAIGVGLLLAEDGAWRASRSRRHHGASRSRAPGYRSGAASGSRGGVPRASQSFFCTQTWRRLSSIARVSHDAVSEAGSGR